MNYENAIVQTSTQVRYKIVDVIKMTNSLQDLSASLKSVARGMLVNIISKKDPGKIEVEKSYIIQDMKVNIYIST